MRDKLLISAAVFLGALAALKVVNELAMTRAYERQAAAQERMADALDRLAPAH